MTAYYNEIDKYAAEWLCNLIDAGLIAPGVVDTRSIVDVRPADLRGFTQCHFFAGIGVWSFALRRAGWPDDRSVWTGSCPCQPFSTAGQGGGFDDERHLWPSWQHLIEQCRPPIVLGEQVASKNVDPWVDLVQDDMEGLAYAFAAIPFPSAGVGAPHIRDRCYWVANAERGLTEQHTRPWHRTHETTRSRSSSRSQRPGATRALANDDRAGQRSIAVSRLHDTQHHAEPRGSVNGFWADADWIACRDGKARPVEPGTFPLAHGAPARVGRLRAYGNAINAEAARVFIEAVIEELA